MRYNDEYDHDNVVVIYHGGCNDGFTAAWAAYMKFGSEAQYFAASYEKPPSYNLVGKNVFVLDFSFSREIMEKIAKVADSVTLLDHHVTAFNNLSDLPYAYFDMTRSGAGIAWDYFHGTDSPRPKIVSHTEDMDLWKFDFANTKEIVSVMETTEKTFENWTELFFKMEDDDEYEILKTKGSAILQYKDYVIRERFVKKPTYVYLDNYIVPAANSAIWQSEIGGALARNNETYAAVWSQMSNGKFKVSLRSDKNVGMDVRVVAEKYGGGGHKNAASFVTDYVPQVVDWEEIDGQIIT